MRRTVRRELRLMNVLCPHCFSFFAYRRIRARCTSRACSEVLTTEGRREPRRLRPNREGLWARKGQTLDLERPCPYCSETGRLQPACPSCWQQLDPETGHADDRLIAILGARQAGKSHYLAALMHQLLLDKVGGEVWQVSIRPEARRTIDRQLLKPLFHDRQELPATPLGSSLAFDLLLTHSRRRQRILLRFQDLAGEVMADPARLRRADSLRYASGVVLLADPLAFEPPAKGRRRNLYHDEPNCAEILDSYRQVLESAPRDTAKKALPLLPEQKFLAVAVTKADLVLGPKHEFWDPPVNGSHLATGYWRERTTQSQTAEVWLRQQIADLHLFEDTVETFADTSYFFVSSYGYRHKPHTRKLVKPPTPRRVHEPIFALLDRFAAGASTSDPRATAKPRPRQPRRIDDEDVL